MNLDDTSINPVISEERMRIKIHSDKAIKKFDETCEKNANNEPKQEWKYVNEFGFANTFTGRWK